MSTVVIPFVVLVAALVVMGLMVGWSIRKARGKTSPIRAEATRRGWTYTEDDVSVSAPLGVATHVVRGTDGELRVLAYEQYPAPGELYCVVEARFPDGPPRPSRPTVPLGEAFLTSTEPRLCAEGDRLVVVQQNRLTVEKLDVALALVRDAVGQPR